MLYLSNKNEIDNDAFRHINFIPLKLILLCVSHAKMWFSEKSLPKPRLQLGDIRESDDVVTESNITESDVVITESDDVVTESYITESDVVITDGDTTESYVVVTEGSAIEWLLSQHNRIIQRHQLLSTKTGWSGKFPGGCSLVDV